MNKHNLIHNKTTSNTVYLDQNYIFLLTLNKIGIIKKEACVILFQQTYACSKSTIETLEKGVKYVQR